MAEPLVGTARRVYYIGGLIVRQSLSCSNCGTTLGENAQTALLQLDGISFDHIQAMSSNSTLLAVSRWVLPEWPPPAMAAPAVSIPCGLPTPLPWRKANSSNQAMALPNS